MFFTRPLKMLPTMLRSVCALDGVFLEHAVLEERHAALEFFGVDDEFVAGLAGARPIKAFDTFGHGKEFGVELC